MTQKQKRILSLIYTFCAIDFVLIVALAAIVLSTAQAKIEVTETGGAAGEIRANAAADTLPKLSATVSSPAGSAIQPGEGTPAQQETPERAMPSGSSTHYFSLVQNYPPPPFVVKNVIVFIGDGMGLEHVKAGGIFANGEAGSLPFERFPYHTKMRTNSASGVTDSAAAATAMATGRRVNNMVVSMAIPGSGGNQFTLLEYAAMHEMSTGLVTTTPVTDATMASFAAHSETRRNDEEIALDYLNDSRPNILFGGGADVISREAASAAGYTFIANREELLALDTEAETSVSGLFAPGYIPYEASGPGSHPHLSEMASVALRILDNDPEGFFVVIEGGRIDTASHRNDTSAMVGEVVEFGRAVQAALDWAAGRSDTVIIVVSDHETGGLKVTENNGQGVLPGVDWTATTHTGARVGVWVTGFEYGELPRSIENTQVPALLTAGAFSPILSPLVSANPGEAPAGR